VSSKKSPVKKLYNYFSVESENQRKLAVDAPTKKSMKRKYKEVREDKVS
jgi:hypothetical protein